MILWTEPESMTIHWKAVEQQFTVVLFLFQFQFVILEKKTLSILDLALSRVKGLSRLTDRTINLSERWKSFFVTFGAWDCFVNLVLSEEDHSEPTFKLHRD